MVVLVWFVCLYVYLSVRRTDFDDICWIISCYWDKEDMRNFCVRFGS